MTLSLHSSTTVEAPSGEQRIQVESTEILRSIEILLHCESTFPPHMKEIAISTVRKLTNILSALDKQCQDAHETLETETICSSALRYKFDNMPSAIQQEIQRIVMSARLSNQAIIDDLQKRLKEMEEEIERLEKEKQITELHTSVIVPTMKNLKREYDSAIEFLNNTLTMRAEIQIALNEARENLEKTNNEIKQLDVNVTELSGELTRETEEHATVKSNLKSALTDTIQKRNTQRKSNTILERDLLLDKDELRDSENELRSQTKRLKRAEDNLKHARSTLTMLDNESETNSCLIQNYSDKIPDLKAKKNAVRREMNEKSEKYKDDVSILSAEVQKIETENEHLRGIKRKLEKETRGVERAGKSVHNELNTIQGVEKRLKTTLLTRAEEAARLRQENASMEMRYKSLQETHEAGIVVMRDQIKHSKELFEKRTQERESIETLLQTKQEKVQTKKEEESKFMLVSNQRMATAQENQLGYKQEIVDLESEIAENSQVLTELEQELRMKSEEFALLERKDSEQMSLIRCTIDELEAELSVLEPDKLDRDVKYNALLEELRAANDQYNEVQQKVINLKAQKNGLSDRIKRMNNETKTLICLQESLRVEILTKRADTKDTMKQFSKQAIELEESLWETTNKMRVVQLQNDHFIESITQLSEEETRMSSIISNRDEVRSSIRDDMDKCRAKLRVDWRDDKRIEREAGNRDKDMLVDMSQFSVIANERKESLSYVCEKMREELERLKDNLENLCSQHDPLLL